jgi:hypothetical protein
MLTTFPAPVGVNLSTPPENLSLEQAAALENLLLDITGSLRPGPLWVPIGVHDIAGGGAAVQGTLSDQAAAGLFALTTWPAGRNALLNVVVCGFGGIGVYQTPYTPSAGQANGYGLVASYDRPLIQYPPSLGGAVVGYPFVFSVVSGNPYAGVYPIQLESEIPSRMRCVCWGNHIYLFSDTEPWGGLDANQQIWVLRVVNGTGVKPLYVQSPFTNWSAPSSAATWNVSQTTGTGNPGTYQISVSATDGYGVEGPLWPSKTITLTGSAGSLGVNIVSPFVGTGGVVNTSSTNGLRYVNFYGTLNGGSVLYRVGQVDATQVASNQYVSFIWSPVDSTTAAGGIGPNIGENGIVPRANMGCIHKGRLWVAVVPSASGAAWNPYVSLPGPVIACSNTTSVEQFASPTGVDLAGNPLSSDGTTLQLSGDTEEIVTGLVSFSDVLVVFTNKSIWAIFGDNPSNFSAVKVLNRGCVAADSIARVGETVLFLSKTGAYRLVYGGYFGLEKVSQAVEGEWHSLFWSTSLGWQQYQMAVGWGVGMLYHVSIGGRIYVLDTERGQWHVETVPGGIGTGVIGAAAALDCPFCPPASLAMVNADRRIWLLDTELEQVPLGALQPVCRWRTGCIGEGVERTTWKRLQRTRLIGSGGPIGATVNVIVDGVMQSFRVNSLDLASHGGSEVGWYEFGVGANMVGRNVQVEWQITSWQPGLRLSGCEVVWSVVKSEGV